jgi:hypothetical protein
LNNTFQRQRADLLSRIQLVRKADFDALALDVFRFQAVHNPPYANWLNLIGIAYTDVQVVEEIPFFPVELFKSYDVQTGHWIPEEIFTSSGTTGQTSSRHLLSSRAWYSLMAKQTFELTYGPLQQYCILALLPAYLERNGSSLVFMVDDFIRTSASPDSGFYLYNTDELARVLHKCQQNNTPTILLGVSFALLDLAESHPMDLSNIIIMETGGMKGRRKELTRTELHQVLKNAFSVASIHSEYGMTELLSQAYAKTDGQFYSGPAMKVIIKDTTDPFSTKQEGQHGLINVIDLANLDTLSFIATQDIGKVFHDGSFEVLGRLDASEIRGCNLMVE